MDAFVLSLDVDIDDVAIESVTVSTPWAPAAAAAAACFFFSFLLRFFLAALDKPPVLLGFSSSG